MSKKGFVVFIIVAGLIIYGLTRIPRFDDPGEPAPETSGTGQTEGGESAVQPRSLIQGGGDEEPDPEEAPAEAPLDPEAMTLQEELAEKERALAERVDAVLESSSDAAYYHQQALQFEEQANSVSPEGQEQIREHLESGTDDERAARDAVYQESLALLQLSALQSASTDEELLASLRVAFDNGHLPVPEDLDAWLQGIDSATGYTEGFVQGEFTHPFDWLLANLQARSAGADAHVDQILGEGGFPEGSAETLRARLRAEMLAGVMSANFLASDEELLGLTLEVEALREELAGTPE